jgi:formate hydrogenlyase transcriptional activator
MPAEYAHTAWYRDIVKVQLKAGCALPLIQDGRALGVLVLGTRQDKESAAHDLTFLQELAKLIANSLSNALKFESVSALHEKLVSEKKYIEDQIRSDAGYEEIVAESPAMLNVLRQVNAVAPTDSIVLILGESGTGKERIARVIHDRSSRSDQSFIKVDCGAIPAALMESELFGHEKGAFTGAGSQKLGRFEVADKGTVFLDEIGDVPLELQTKLLRVLQDYEFQRLGSNRVRHLDVRVIAATNRNLEEMIGKGQFREDLYYRLKVFPITIPPLRERPEEVQPLVRHYVAKYAQRMKKIIGTVPAPAMEVFMRYHWPGNVRELQHFMERSVILSTGPILHAPLGELEHVIRNQVSKGRRPPERRTMEEIERESILQALNESNWVIGGSQGAAAKLGLKRTTLASKIERLGIPRPHSAGQQPEDGSRSS